MSDILNDPIKYVTTLNTNKPQNGTIDELYTKLRGGYAIKGKKGIVCFEYYDVNIVKVKPHIDFEEYIEMCDFSADYEAQMMTTILITLNPVVFFVENNNNFRVNFEA